MNQKKRNESLEALLKESLKVKAIGSQKHVPKRVKTSQPTLVKYHPKPKKPTTLDFIEKLKQIDTKKENASFLEQANEEIDIAFKQLQEIQKLIARKAGEEDEETKRRSRCTVVDKCNKQIERMQKKYLNKTKIRYKSLQDFENVTLGRGEARSVTKGGEVEVLFSKKKNATNNHMVVPEVVIQAAERDKIRSLLKSEEIVQNEEERRTNRVKFEDRRIQQSILDCDSASSTSTEDLDDTTDENRSSTEGNSYLKPRYQRKLQKIDESIMTSDFLLSKNVGDNSEKYPEGREKLNLLLHGKKELFGKFDDSEIADSVLKSAYLSKEFGVGVKNGFSKVNKDGVEKRSSMQLVEAVVNKFRNQLQPNQLANLKGRDWKLYSKLTSALENTLFTEVKK